MSRKAMGNGEIGGAGGASPGGSAGVVEASEAVSAERVAARWLSALGYPSWMSDAEPGAEGRYGLVLHDGRRLAVGPWPRPGWTFEAMARAKCDFLLGIGFDGEGQGRPAGFLTWWDVRALTAPDQALDFEKTGARDAGELPCLLEKPRHAKTAWLWGCLRLLVAGEIPAPPPGDWSHLDLPSAGPVRGR